MLLFFPQKFTDSNQRKAAQIARDIIRKKLLNEIVEIKEVKYDKYGRILAIVNWKGEEINNWLLENTWAAKYEGKGKKLAEKMNWKKRIEEYETEQAAPSPDKLESEEKCCHTLCVCC